jgi:hypothetical protein
MHKSKGLKAIIDEAIAEQNKLALERKDSEPATQENAVRLLQDFYGRCYPVKIDFSDCFIISSDLT